MKVPIYRRIATKISVLSVLLVAATIVFFAISIYLRDKRLLEKQHGLALQRVVTLAAGQIDGDAHHQIRNKKDADGLTYRKIQHILQSVQSVHGLQASHIHSYRFVGKDRLKYAVGLSKHMPIGVLYTIARQHRRALNLIQKKKKPTYSKIYSAQKGTWISAYAPILNEKKELKGLIQADLQVDQIYQTLQNELRWLILLSFSSVLLAIIVSLLFAQRINRALKRLTQGVEAIKLNDYRHHIELDRYDELGVVAEQFNEMADVIATRVELLKYLPKHTLEAISRRSRTGSVYQTEYVKGTVVFTDLRGYTSLSETLTPEQIIEMLNTYIQRQSDIFDRYGGTIDKLIGDGVLAVFKDFAHIHRAVEASVDIQNSIQKLNEEKAFPIPLQVGIGIATGYLVFGEIGSDLRKERILFGSEVNLASRLSKIAQADEVIISDVIRHQLGKSLEIARTEEIEITGFSDKQIIHSVTEIGSFASQKTWTV